MVEPLFLGAVFAIMWLSGSLFAEDIQAWHEAERRVERCPKRL
jgi:formate hydrogenlyase subunit 4